MSEATCPEARSLTASGDCQLHGLVQSLEARRAGDTGLLFLESGAVCVNRANSGLGLGILHGEVVPGLVDCRGADRQQVQGQYMSESVIHCMRWCLTIHLVPRLAY